MTLALSRLKTSKAPHGFTIVELLIVVVVIAILAAITIVAYNGIQNRAKASAAQSSAQQALKKIQAYVIINNDQYPPELNTAEITSGNGSTYQYSVDNTATPKTFCLTSTTSNVSYYVSSTVTTPTAGACTGHNLNGTITNIVPNPRLANNNSSYGGAGDITNSARVAVADLPGFSWAWTANAISANDRIYTQPTGTNLTIGATYTASFWGKAAAGMNVAPQVASASGVSYAITTATTATGGWQRFSATFIPTGTTWRIAFRQQSAGAGTLSMTGVMLTEGSNQYNYADGSSPGWAWNGTADNSSSTGLPL